jgi:asparaginyl-tRNA synthetase
VLRVRDTAASAIRDFFHENGFIELHTPILTSSDCEGTFDETTFFLSRRFTMTLTPTGQHTHTHHTHETQHNTHSLGAGEQFTVSALMPASSSEQGPFLLLLACASMSCEWETDADVL